MNFKNLLGGLKCKSIKYSPEIFVVAGCVSLVTAGVVACKQTLKLKSVQDKYKEIFDQIKALEEAASENKEIDYSPEDAKRDRRIVTVKKYLGYAKLYIVPVGLAILGFLSIFKGDRILRGRNAALAAAYTTIDKSFKEYRKRVVDQLGEDADKKFKFGTTTVEEKEKVKDEETGKTKTVKKSTEVTNGGVDGYSDYAKFFDCGNIGWSDDPEESKSFLRKQEMFFTNKLRKKGYVFLNEVYRALGIRETKAGQVVGWFYDPSDKNRDNYVSFGIFDVNKPKNGDFVNGIEKTIILDFNVDGPIVDLI